MSMVNELVQQRETATELPPLPHWESTPDDLREATRTTKAALRRRIEASGRTVEQVFAVIEERVTRRVEEIEAALENAENAWPVVEFADIESGRVSAADLALLQRRGCLVVRGHFPREQALGWDRGIVDYVERNRFFETYQGPADDFFGSVGSKPEIYPVYWSPAQMEARQHDRMATVQSFLNAQWKSSSEGVQWFDPARDSLYPDRIRRRPPGADSGGLGTHLDPGTLDLWMTRAYQKAFRHLFDGSVEQYDPWDAAYRTAGPQYPGSTMCSAFRTFQGWTALSDMDHDQGVLHTVPIPEAVECLILRPARRRSRGRHVRRHHQPDLSRQREVALPPAACLGRDPGRQGRRLGVAALRHDPQRRSGHRPEGLGQWRLHPGGALVAPGTGVQRQRARRFATGSSPSDFPEEDYERDWVGRFTAEKLNRTGRRGLGLD